MAQLHEVLAVIKDLEQRSEKTFKDVLSICKEKTEMFFGNLKTLRMFNEDRTVEEKGFREAKDLATTVDVQLNMVIADIERYWNAVAQREYTNVEAKADVILPSGEVMAKDVPVPLLLFLEDRIEKLKTLYESLPILPLGVQWVPDSDRMEGVFKTQEPDIKHKTEKVRLHKEISPATKEHIAQIDTWTEDRAIGEYINVRWCGAITIGTKRQRLDRITEILLALKKARMRANTAIVKEVSIGDKFFKYINGSTL